jgi:hypothetical protein
MGNSHLAAAKLGWSAIADEYPDFAIEFFGFPPNSSVDFDTHVKVVERSLVASTDFLQQGFRLTAGGKTKIDGADYSAFVTFGLGLAGPGFVARQICAKHRLIQHAETHSHLFSKACLAATIDDVLRSEKALSPFRAIRAVSSAPIFFQSIPASTVRIKDDPAHADDLSIVPGMFADVSRIFESRCAEIAVENIHYLAQPEVTLDESGLTKDEFIVDGVGFPWFSGGTKQGNIGHGNKAYGIVVMRRLLHELAHTKLSPQLELCSG